MFSLTMVRFTALTLLVVHSTLWLADLKECHALAPLPSKILEARTFQSSNVFASSFSKNSANHCYTSSEMFRLSMARYGPEDGESVESQEEWERAEAIRKSNRKKEFQKLLQKIQSTSNPEHLPGIMTKKIDLLLSMRGYEGVSLLKNAIEKAEEGGNQDEINSVTSAAEYIVSFVEAFVEQTKAVDDEHIALMGKIIRCIATKDEKGGKKPGRDEEIVLDELMEKEKENFTPGFLRYLEGECQRIASAPKTSPESAKMLQTMRIIQARIVEELGKDLGEGALVLGQLLGYDDRTERLAVLDAGLTVRGIEFAEELAALTEEALQGFQEVPGGADPGLIKIVTEIDDRIQSFIGKSENCFQ